jgi:regulator of protease activity HflC (stomatin/prohibitin superfamily)
MERSKQKYGLVNLLALVGVGLAALTASRYAHSLAGVASTLFLGLGTLVAIASWFQMRLEDNERLEKLEFDELAKSHTGSALFAAKEAEAFPAQRSREQFERYFVPIFTSLLCLAQAGAAFLFWRWLSRATTIALVTQPTMGIALFALFAVILFLLGRFSATIARLENQRLLRPSASYVLVNAVFSAAVTLGMVFVWLGYPKSDLYVAYALCVVLALVALENLISLVLEIYRPRLKGKVERPLYESRLVGLLGQPEGLVTTAAQALDYQFGFNVSETWFYRLFFEKALKWVVLAQAAILVLSTCVVFIEAGEQGLLERFGKPVEGRALLEPGGHFKWPWPIDQVYRYRTEQIQSFEIGVAAGSGLEEQKARKPSEERVVLWTVKHSDEQEDNFLVASREPASPQATNDVVGKRVPPVSLITGTMPVQYQITNLTDWAYNYQDAPGLLQSLARREIVRYFLNSDMNEIMSSSRIEASEELRSRIQTAADQRRLGVRIISFGLQDMHPPVNVAPDYEKVVAAIQTKEAKILAARADGIRTNAQAAIRATRLINTATAGRAQRELGALARVTLFTNQMAAFQAAPSVYSRRAYLQTLTRATANTRKYLLLTTNTQDVLIFDLQESLADKFLNTTVPQPIK